ncbi:ATP-binding protein [Algoriphagus sp.]|uniref:ATP-binding protein n=1 Tax=Algoriphagus sp. TaxID=1872435 RepID=UPI00271D47D8|nr:ATP-binding protein [Algoriphagus sp.]MDO8965734.1 ATP-binding protein [Algoriphagus sp.]MDP3198829.1 ATP-binding protein [Algoriphagus sp.]
MGDIKDLKENSRLGGDNKNNNELFFKTNVQLKSIIGKDLINDDNIAILELVKNSFDADAKQVKVKYYNLKENDDKNTDYFSIKTSRLLIQDDGVGMDIKDIRDKWLNIAYSEKKINRTQHNRRMAGAKGVGRFSCDRLGEYLNLYSKTKSDPNYIKLSIDWKKFEIEDEDTEIQSIPLHHEILTPREFQELGFIDFKHGVLLEIIKLRSKWAYTILDKKGKLLTWDVSKFVELKKYLEKLINPNQAFESNDFGIWIDAPEFEKENGELEKHEKFIGIVENRIFEELDFKTTSIEVQTTKGGSETLTTLKDKGEVVFWIREKNNYFPYVKNAKATIYYLSTYAKSFFTKQTGIRSVDYGSIFLFINGFRIPPYGDDENDWLGIDHRKAQGHSRNIGLREIVGQIEILDESNDFQIISSREGIVKNDNFKQLVQSSKNNSFFFKAFRRLERYVVEGLNWDSSIYDNKDGEESNTLKEIESKIISGAISEEELIFREDERTKNNRIYTTIHSIISAKAIDVIELYINENLITQKIEEERETSEREFKQLIEDFSNKKIDADTLNKILQKKASENEELERQLKEFSKFTTNDATSKAILELQNYQSTIEEQTELIKDLQFQLQELVRQKESAEVEKEKAQSEVEEVRKELVETKSQNLFLKSVKSQDFNDVVNLMHHIGISTGTIQNFIKGAIFKLDNNLAFETGELKNVFSKLNYELNKIYSISKFATKANFKVEAKDSVLDLVSFIEQYFINIIKPFLPKKIALIVYEHDVREFITVFKPIELIIILDNLINNAKKSISEREKTKSEFYNPKIEISFFQVVDSEIKLSIKDNGIGISKNNVDKIFEYGFTTTEGSGLGLTHVKELIEKMHGDIYVNNNYADGAEFILTFLKK